MTRWSLLLLALAVMACSSTVELTPAENAKLDVPLRMILAGQSPPAAQAAGTTVRPDGSKEYHIVIRGGSAADFQAVGVNVGSALGEIFTARVTAAELRKIAKLPAVRSVELGSQNQPHR